MEFFRDLWLSAARPLELFKKYRVAPRVLPAAVITGAACIASAAGAPLASRLFGQGAFPVSLTLGSFAEKLGVSAASVLLACLLFKLLAALYHKPVPLRLIFATWGTTFTPTLLCIAAVEASEARFYAFLGNTWLGLGLCTFLVGLLALKAILFFLELNVVLGLKCRETAWAVVLTGAAYLLIMMASLHLGLKVPML